MPDDLATPQPLTISGRAWISSAKPYMRRGIAPTIVAIEREAAAPYAAALAQATAVLAELIDDPATDPRLKTRAEAARASAAPLLP